MESDLQKNEELKKDMKIIRDTVAKCRSDGKDNINAIEERTKATKAMEVANASKDEVDEMAAKIADEHAKKAESAAAFEIEMHIMTELPELYEQYPFLIKRLSKSIDDSYLDKFLKGIEEVAKGEKSLAAVELNFGLELKKTFIDSVLDKKK